MCGSSYIYIHFKAFIDSIRLTHACDLIQVMDPLVLHSLMTSSDLSHTTLLHPFFARVCVGGGGGVPTVTDYDDDGATDE